MSLALLAAGSVALAADFSPLTNDILNCGGPTAQPVPQDCGCDPCCEQGCCDRWYGQVEMLFLTRSNSSSFPAVIRVTDEGNALPGTTVLTTNSPTFNYEPGMRFLLGWRQDDCQAFELSYLGIFNWNATATAIGNNDLAIPGDLGLASLDFFAADRMVLSYQSNLHNVEANWVRGYDAWSFLAGLRYLTLNEVARIRSTDLDTGTSDYRIGSSNDLFGGQVGARLRKTWDRFGLDATAKAGLFGNAASQSQSVTDFPPGFFLRDARSASGGQIAFVGDLNISGCYQLNDLWSLRAGYNLLWIEGVALAPAQFDFTDTPDSGTQLQSSGGFFAHGVNLGVEARW